MGVSMLVSSYSLSALRVFAVPLVPMGLINSRLGRNETLEAASHGREVPFAAPNTAILGRSKNDCLHEPSGHRLLLDPHVRLKRNTGRADIPNWSIR